MCDNIISTRKNEEQVKEFKQILGKEYDVKDLSTLHCFPQNKNFQDIWEMHVLVLTIDNAKCQVSIVNLTTQSMKSHEGDESYNQSEHLLAVGNKLCLSFGTRLDLHLP